MVYLSITITAKDESPVIDRVIRSVINQIERADINYELILVDNYSKDDTYNIMKKYVNERIKVYRYKGRKGAARNFALLQSEGKYVMALDADQIYNEFSIFLNDYFRNYSMFGVKIGRSSFPIIAPRDLLIKVGGWRNLQYAEDWDLWFRLTDNCRYIYLPGYDFVFGEHLRDHKVKQSFFKKIYRGITKARDLYSVGLPITLNDRKSKLIYKAGKILYFFNGERKANYKCVKYIEEPLEFDLDWDIKFHYNLMKFEVNNCNTNRDIFANVFYLMNDYIKKS